VEIKINNLHLTVEIFFINSKIFKKSCSGFLLAFQINDDVPQQYIVSKFLYLISLIFLELYKYLVLISLDKFLPINQLYPIIAFLVI